jgi:hypothetical protein
MSLDPKRELLRHMVATVVFRGRVAVESAPPEFAHFRINESTRTPAEILAHIGDLLAGTHLLLRGEFATLASEPLEWADEIARFFTAAEQLVAFLASEEPLAYPVEKFVQGPIGDALTHVGQIVMLRRVFGAPVRSVPYFTAEIDLPTY